jgi:hypothetical protein
MHAWGWDQLQPWISVRINLPVGPLFCVINGATRATVVKLRRPRRAPPHRGARGRSPAIRPASATTNTVTAAHPPPSPSPRAADTPSSRSNSMH